MDGKRSISDMVFDWIIRYVIALILGSAVITGLVAAFFDKAPLGVVILEILGAAAAVSLLRAGLVGDRARVERQNDPRITLGQVDWESPQVTPATPDQAVTRLTVHLTVAAVAVPVSVSTCRLRTARGVLDCVARRDPPKNSLVRKSWGLTPSGTQMYNIHPDMLRFPIQLDPHTSTAGYVHFMDRTDFPTPREIKAHGATLSVVANGLEWDFDIAPVLG